MVDGTLRNRNVSRVALDCARGVLMKFMTRMNRNSVVWLRPSRRLASAGQSAYSRSEQPPTTLCAAALQSLMGEDVKEKTKARSNDAAAYASID
jgi:hypothetical protein